MVEIKNKLLGQKLRPTSGGCDYIVVTGIRSLRGEPYIYGIYVKNGLVVGETTPEGSGGAGPLMFDYLESPPSALPSSIEPLMKQFGCHEKQTRALVAAILEHVKEKK